MCDSGSFRHTLLASHRRVFIFSGRCRIALGIHDGELGLRCKGEARVDRTESQGGGRLLATAVTMATDAF